MDVGIGRCRNDMGRTGLGVLAVAMAAGMAWGAAPGGPADRPSHADRTVLVKFRADATTSTRGKALGLVRGTAAGSVGKTGVTKVRLPAAGAGSEEEAARLLARQPGVEFAEVDRLLSPAEVTPNDPLFVNQLFLHQISAPAAWGIAPGRAGVTIAIIDTGVEGTHPDLSPVMAPGWNIYSNNSNAADVQGHGTMVAGTAAAAGNNAVGVASVAYGCRIMPIRVSDTSGVAMSSAIASGLTWAVDHGARVCNISYRVSESSTVRTAAQYAQQHGAVVAIAAGNDGIMVSTADNPYVLTVSAVDLNDNRFSWSNYGNIIDVAAPGQGWTTAAGATYAGGGGTSFASPVAAGVAALVLSANPTLSSVQAMNIVRASADDLGPAGWDVTYGYGRLNAERAVTMALGTSAVADVTPPSVSFSSPGAGSLVFGTVTVAVSASDDVGVTGVGLSAGATPVGSDSSSPYSFAWNTTSVADGDYLLTATARDAAGNSSTTTMTLRVANTPDTTPPTVAILSPTAGTRLGRSVTTQFDARDNRQVARVELYVDGKLTGSSTTAPFTIKFQTRKLSSGTHTLTAKAYDAAGNIATSAGVGVTK